MIKAWKKDSDGKPVPGKSAYNIIHITTGYFSKFVCWGELDFFLGGGGGGGSRVDVLF